MVKEMLDNVLGNMDKNAPDIRCECKCCHSVNCDRFTQCIFRLLFVILISAIICVTYLYHFVEAGFVNYKKLECKGQNETYIINEQVGPIDINVWLIVSASYGLVTKTMFAFLIYFLYIKNYKKLLKFALIVFCVIISFLFAWGVIGAIISSNNNDRCNGLLNKKGTLSNSINTMLFVSSLLDIINSAARIITSIFHVFIF